MPVRPDLQQLEKCIDDALRRNDFKPLMTLFQIDIHEDVKIKCSKQFLHKLDDLICREFNKQEINTLTAILISIGRCGKNISILGQSGLLTMIKQGLVPKMVSWFEQSKEIILSRGQSKDEAVINMTEDLFDLLMIIYDISDEGKKQVVESFVPRICALIVDSRVNIFIKQEALKKMNAILDKMPQDARKILCTEEMLTLMSNMGERILNAGDYDLQVGIVEALCRMTTEKQRQELACQWFPMDCIAKAFKGIKDCDFETDCRVFLNLVNGMLGDKRSVFTFPCLSAFLDKYELQIPSDDKLEEFWIDFNLGSQTLSFYIAGDDDDHQWEAVTVPEEKVHIYSIEVRESKKILSIIMKNVVKISKREGKELLLYFDASLEIMNVTQKLFGANKYKEFTRKQSISIAKTSVHIIFDASGSQILVPESQSSPIKEDLVHFNEKSNLSKSFASPSKHISDSNPEDRNSQIEITTPIKRKMSEASMIIPDAERYPVRSPVLLVNTSTPRKRIKLPLQMMSSTEKADVSKTSKTGMDNAVSHKPKPSERRYRGNNMDNHIKTTEVVEKTENKDTECPDQNFNELQDSQAVGKINQSVLPNVTDNICRNRMHSRWACWTPVTTIKLCNNQRASIISGDSLPLDTGVSRKCTRPKLPLSVDGSEETQKVNYRKEMTEPNKTDKAENCKKNSEQQSHSKGSEPQRSATSARPRDWHVESETTFKSVLLNKTTEESLIYEKKCILSKDMNTTICDKNPALGKNVRNHTKSVKELTSESNSCNLKQKPMREKSKGSGFTDAAESLINQINKRYNPTDNRKSTRKSKELNVSGFSNKSGLQLSKVRKKSYRKLKTTFINVTSECPLNDVYNFSLNGANEPVIKLGIQEFQSTARETSMDNSIKLVGIQNYDGCDPSHKTKDKRLTTSHEKKTLFSDTETEYGCDDGKTDISWLEESKSKRQLIDYSRNKNVKKYRSRKSRPSLEKGQPTAAVSHKGTTNKEEEIVRDGRTRLPRRATKTKKNYKDISTSESECEQEFSHSLKEKEKLPVQEETIHSRTQTMKLLKKQQKAFSTETPKGPPKEKKSSPEQQDYVNNNSLDSSFLSASGSSSVEVLRCIEKITESDFTQDYDYITKSLSPYPKPVPPESSNSSNKVGGLGNSLKNNDTNSLSARESCSPILRPHVMESHAASPLSMSSERREKIWVDMTSDNTHVSGPSHHHSHKHMYIEDYLSDFDEEEESEGRAQLLHGRVCQTEVSESITPNFPISEDWQYDLTDARMISKAINSDYKRKMDTQHKILDDFMNQTCTMIEDHMKTLNHEVVELRADKLEKFHLIIIDEMKKHEKDAQSMKDLEKELLDFGEKTLEKLRAYHKNDRERIHLLMTSLDKISVFNTDHEEAIFTSKMSSVKENMKLLQERLLQEMHEKDLLDLRRGLDSIFRLHEGNTNM
uniref:synaptonemal complex protein 2 n=1 Tax=Jaculus jaculus TaxID=51337 RepID=UPI001E1B0440|nr:synaptonemal complex protein 2 [Jaculus jaculus]